MSDESPFEPREPRRITGRAPEPPDRRRPVRRQSRARGGDGQGSGRRLLVLVALAGLGLALLLVILFVPPIALIGGNDDEADATLATAVEEDRGRQIAASTRSRMPDVPEHLRAASLLYDLSVPPILPGPFAITLRLIQPTQDQRNLGAYTYRDGAWERITAALLTDKGAGARVELEVVPSNLAILRRLQFQDTVTGRLPAGAEIAVEALNVLTIINPVGFTPAEDASLLGRVEALPPDVTQPVYPVVFAGEPEADIINTVIASSQLRRQHINNILLMVQTGRHDGVDIDYQVISTALRAAFSEFITELADQLHRDGRGLCLTVPLPRRDASGVDEGAYNFTALGAAADLLKLVVPRDQSVWAETLAAGMPWVLERVPSEKVLLTLSPYSVEKSLQGFRLLSQREALGLASELSVREAGPILTNQRVTLVGENIFLDAGASGLFWDRFANMVSFVAPQQTDEPVTVWVENRFSIAFKLEVVAQYELGGLALEDVSGTEETANLWEVISSFLESGEAVLVMPNPELLVPVWEADVGELSGSGGAGWVVWETPTIPDDYEVRLIVSDGDVRVGHGLTIAVEP